MDQREDRRETRGRFFSFISRDKGAFRVNDRWTLDARRGGCPLYVQTVRCKGAKKGRLLSLLSSISSRETPSFPSFPPSRREGVMDLRKSHEMCENRQTAAAAGPKFEGRGDSKKLVIELTSDSTVRRAEGSVLLLLPAVFCRLIVVVVGCKVRQSLEPIQPQGVPSARGLGWVDLDLECSPLCPILSGLM